MKTVVKKTWIMREDKDTFYIKTTDGTEYLVNKEEFMANGLGATLKLESKVAYKWKNLKSNIEHGALNIKNIGNWRC